MRPVSERRELRTRYIIDNSVWQRVRRDPVRIAMDRLLAVHSPWAILTCPPVVAEVGFSTRSGKDHDAVRRYLSAFPDCESHPSSELVLDIQNSLFNRGLVRAVGAVDTVIAAYGIVNEATVLHYDGDFEHIAKVRADFGQAWIAPRGTLDR